MSVLTIALGQQVLFHNKQTGEIQPAVVSKLIPGTEPSVNIGVFEATGLVSGHSPVPVCDSSQTNGVVPARCLDSYFGYVDLATQAPKAEFLSEPPKLPSGDEAAKPADMPTDHE